MQTTITWIKNHKKTIALVVIVLVGGFFFLQNKNKNDLKRATVVKGTVTEQVAVTGKTEADQSVELAFETSGRVQNASLSVGQKVSAGQMLARLDQSVLSANLAKAKADLLAEQIKLDQTGKRSENAYDNARTSMIAAIRDAYIKTDDAIGNNIDKYYFNKNTGTASFINFSFIDGSYSYNPVIGAGLLSSVNTARATLDAGIDAWQTSLIGLDSATDLAPFVAEAEKNLNTARVYLNVVADVVNNLPPTEFAYRSILNGYKNDVSGARTIVSGAISNVVTAKDKLNSAPKEVASSTGGGENFDDVLSQQARVAQFEAGVKSSEALLAKAILVSPISGVITRYDTKVGQIVNPGTPLISIITQDDLIIKASVSEVNIGRVQIGDLVAVTFDAFGNQAFNGKVIAIEPAETIVDNVANYVITVVLEGPGTGLKSGLTANLKIVTSQKTDVLTIPEFAIISKNGKQYVEKVLPDGKSTQEVEITTGLRGSDGVIEITSGLTEGDIVNLTLK